MSEEADRNGGLAPLLSRGCLILILVPLLCLGWIVWRASDWGLPEIARGLRGGAPTEMRGEDRFKQRIAGRYPIGSSEARLRTDMVSAGFKISRWPDGQTQAVLSRFIGCGNLEWSVRWRASHGVLTEVVAVWGAVCL